MRLSRICRVRHANVVNINIEPLFSIYALAAALARIWTPMYSVFIGHDGVII
jgi:hypothetical protein